MNCNRRSAKCRRGGFTIIEVITVLVVAIALLGGAVSLMAIAGRSHQQSKQNLLRRQGIRRFAEDLRRDVSLADDRKINDGKLVLINSALGAEVSYRPDSRTAIIRNVQKTENEIASSDQYIVGRDATIEVNWIDEINAVQWTITEAGSGNQPIEIIAAGTIAAPRVTQ